MTFFDRFQLEHLVEIRAIRNNEVKRFWIHPAEYDPTFLVELNTAGFHIFAGVNPRSHQAGDEMAVKELVAFHADVDRHLSRFACQTPQCNDTPKASLTVDSGHGQHFYWYLTEPVSVTDENRNQLKAINRGLAIAVGGDPACCDLSRVLRVPGFINHKLPIAPVGIIEDNGRQYPLEDFPPHAIETQNVEPVETDIPLIELPVECMRQFYTLRAKTPDLSRAWRGEIGDGSSDSRYALVRILVEHEFLPAEILAIVCSRQWFNRFSRKFRTRQQVQADTKRLIGKLSSSHCGRAAKQQVIHP